MSIPTLLARIRKLISTAKNGYYANILRRFEDGSFDAPVTPMSDYELGQAIAEFMEDEPVRLDKHLKSLRRDINDQTRPARSGASIVGWVLKLTKSQQQRFRPRLYIRSERAHVSGSSLCRPATNCRMQRSCSVQRYFV